MTENDVVVRPRGVVPSLIGTVAGVFLSCTIKVVYNLVFAKRRPRKADR